MRRGRSGGDARCVWVGAFALLGALLAGCESDAGGCTPGASVACACEDGRTGAQRCGDDRRLGECRCLDRDGAAPDGIAVDVAADARPVEDAALDAATDATTPDAAMDATTTDAATDATTVDAVTDTPTVDAATDAPLALDVAVDAPSDGARADATPEASSAAALRGEFVPGVAQGAALRGRITWHGSVRLTGGGVTLEGRLQ